jgi:hypothetical protein
MHRFVMQTSTNLKHEIIPISKELYSIIYDAHSAISYYGLSMIHSNPFVVKIDENNQIQCVNVELLMWSIDEWRCT